MNTGKEIECKLCGIFHDADDEWCSLKREDVVGDGLLADCNLKEHTAIISIDSDGGGSLMKWSEYVEDWHKEDHECMNLLPEYDFGKPIGVYQATMKGGYCAGSKCDGYPCAGDCYETEWEIGANLFILA